jgi:predicted alpha/beta hydrolase family esterase
VTDFSAPATPRLLIVPGLGDSPPGHWQSWLQDRHPGAVRVTQRDWERPELERWAARVGSVLDRAGPGRWLAVAHSFGALALVRHLALTPGSPVAAALLVAPADPDKWGIGELLPQRALPVPSTVVLSSSDPWLALPQGQRWAQRWGSACVNLGAVGHVNVAAGFSRLPLAEHWLQTVGRRLAAEAPSLAA